ncbi:hypothetical protein BTUL_0215g00050 [Botrytis tulipae]|uniref:Uncharacterized protein n=1 Tax=Botrytis tulipae TaxID=87230 RepID=A0A4Z1EC60_9HELO|nr:hypothetical protein BTUL_0215g00050 [Botrytis tulipae]
MLWRLMAARGYENRNQEARKVPDQSIPIIPILTPADSEWKYISPTFHYAGTNPVAERFANNVSSSSNTSVAHSDISMNPRLKDARVKLKMDILRLIGPLLKNDDQTQVIKLRLRFDHLQVGIAETDYRIERLRTEKLRIEKLRIERAELDMELREARAQLASIDANLASDEMVDGELGEDEMDEDEMDEEEMDEDEMNENDVSGENGREENEKGENEPEEEIEDHKIDEYKKEEGEALDEKEDKKVDEYEMEGHKTKKHKKDENPGREKDDDKKEHLDQEEQSDTSNTIPSSPDVKSGSSKIAWIDTVPLLGELNTHLAGHQMDSSAEETMDIRSWIDKGFDTGIRRLLRDQPIADILASWDNIFDKEGLNNILRSVVLVYDSIEDLHTLRAHCDRILGEAVLALHSRVNVRDAGRNDHETDFGKSAL